MNNSFKILFIVLLIVISRFVLWVDYNEMDVLPSAYAAFNPDWLSKDWYLSLSIPYRYLFGYIVGFFIDIAGFVPVLLVGRLVTYILFAYAYFRLIETIKVNFFIGCIALMAYLYVFADGAFYGEWIVGGLETKAFSYVFLLLSLSSYLKGELKPTLIFAGFCLSFHILIGGYFAICLLVVAAIKMTKDESTLMLLFRNSYLFAISGIWGFYGIYVHLSSIVNDTVSSFGWEIYTQLRVPYHVMPKFSFWSLFVPLALTLFSLIVFKFSKKNALRQMSILVFATYAISLMGYFVYLIEEPSLLRFYFFRISDCLAPLLSLLILGSILSSRLPLEKRFSKIPVLAFVICFLCFLLVNLSNVKSLVSPSNYSKKSILSQSTQDLKMTEWIKENTSKESVFIVPISMSNFYIEAERALFVSWKHSPQSASEMREWYKRMTLINKGMDLKTGSSFYPEVVEENYASLTEEDLSKIRNDYSEVSHIILPKDTFLQFPVIYQIDKYKLYKLE